MSGTVTLDGNILPTGRILFITNQGDGEVKASATIQGGFYSFDKTNGPLHGKARVEIHPVEMELEEFEAARTGDPNSMVDFIPVDIPPQYNVNSKLTADVSADADENLFSFELKSE